MAGIVSLVPSLTELLFWLGAGDAVAGRTRFCEAPAGLVERVPIVGGTKNPRLDRILALEPELVIANREENRREDVEALRAAGLEVLVTDPCDLPGAIAMVRELGERLGCTAKAEALARETEEALANVVAPARKPRVFVAIWLEPLMGLGGESYGHDLVERCGAENVLAARPRYPELTLAELASLAPDLILLPDEPYPFAPRHLPVFEGIAPARIVDGKLLWWYGPRMPAAIRALNALFLEAER